MSSGARLQESPLHENYLPGHLLVGLAFVLPMGKPAVSTFHLHAARWLRWRGLGPKLVYHVAAEVLVQAPIGVLSRGNNCNVGAVLPLTLASLLVGEFAPRVPGPMADRAATQAFGFCLQRLHLISAFIQGEMRSDNLAFTFAFPAALGLLGFCLAKRSVCGKLELDRMSTLGGLLGIKLLEAI